MSPCWQVNDDLVMKQDLPSNAVIDSYSKRASEYDYRGNLQSCWSAVNDLALRSIPVILLILINLNHHLNLRRIMIKITMMIKSLRLRRGQEQD